MQRSWGEEEPGAFKGLKNEMAYFLSMIISRLDNFTQRDNYIFF